MVEHTGWFGGLVVTGTGKNLVSHAGTSALRMLSDQVGLTQGLSKALAGHRVLVHDRGRVLTDLAVSIADGAEIISGIAVMGESEELWPASRRCRPRGGVWTRSPLPVSPAGGRSLGR